MPPQHTDGQQRTTDIARSDNYRQPKSLAFIGVWVLLLLAVVAVYWPGLGGPFVLDDQGSLGALGNLGGVSDWESFKVFILGGSAGPTGRPVALLSFLIDANTWPTDAWPFKRTNLVIHLLNGSLLGLLLHKILRVSQFGKRDSLRIAMIAAALWLLHPFLVSTTLYAVQRMAQLSALFVFAGLIGHLYSRDLLAQKSPYAYPVMCLSICTFTLLATLSKENGVLLPSLVGVLEITIISSQRQSFARLDRRWTGLFVIAPTLFIIAYLGARSFTGDFFTEVPPREFSLYERSLTQSRILIDYLQNWFIPKLYTTGVFQDHFAKSTGILSPITTLFSILFHIAAITIALLKRRTWPLFSLAVLFFYVSHLLESTVLNLELYFEHRNYLSAAILFLPLVVLFKEKVSTRAFVGILVACLLVLGSFTRYSATIWGDFPSMVQASARKAPTSARAQAQYATILFNAGHYEQSLQVIDEAIQNVPTNNPLLLINRIIIMCNLGILDDTEFQRVAGDVSKRFYDVRSIKLYTNLTSAVAAERCPKVRLTSLTSMYDAMLAVSYNANPDSKEYAHIKYFSGLVYTHLKRPTEAVASFKESIQAEPGASQAMTMAAFLATNRYFNEALLLSEIASQHLNDGVQGQFSGTPVSQKDIRAFQEIVRADIADASSTSTDRTVSE